MILSSYDTFKIIFKMFNIKTFVMLALSLILVITAYNLVIVRYKYKAALDLQQKSFLKKQKLIKEQTQISIEYSLLSSSNNLQKYILKNKMVLPLLKNIKIIDSSTFDE